MLVCVTSSAEGKIPSEGFQYGEGKSSLSMGMAKMIFKRYHSLGDMLAEDMVKANNASILQMAQNIETFKRDSEHQYRFLREKIEKNTGQLEQLDGHIIEMNQRLGVIVEHLARNGESVRDG